MSRVRVVVGCCGFPVSMKRYVTRFNAVEVQSTFYRVHERKTLERWRRSVPEDFVFSVKAFQGVTHPPNSPTWRRSNVRPKPGHGLLRMSREVMESWELTLEACRALRAEFCVVQTPAAFNDAPQNVENALRFFKEIERDGITVGFEPRGWSEPWIRKVCEEADLVYVVDPFAGEPVHLSSRRILYLRLHGSPPGKRMYSYTYTDGDLQRLERFLRRFEFSKAYVMFNNVTMFDDAYRFLRLLQETGWEMDQSMSK